MTEYTIELLEKWAKLEPSRCRFADEQGLGSFDYAFTYQGTWCYAGALKYTIEQRPPILFGIIETIAEKRWKWTITNDAGGHAFKAIVETTPGEPRLFCAAGYSLDNAILKAYLDALEAYVSIRL